jgi:hypothetical protein
MVKTTTVSAIEPANLSASARLYLKELEVSFPHRRLVCELHP